jgi:pimeloyl-ACP methyl ester carboxylesterase
VTLASSAAPEYVIGGGGTRIAIDRTGSPDSPAVILLHGGGQKRQSWRRTARHLAEAGWLAIACDVRGHGDSDPASDGDYGYDRLVEDAAALIEVAGGRAVLVGASLGGKIALAAAGKLPPEMIRALVLVDAVPRSLEGGIARVASILRPPPDGFDSPQAAATALAAANGTAPARDAGERLQRNMRRDAAGRWHWHWDPWFFDPSHGLGIQPALERLEDAARRVTMPALLVRGGLSDVTGAAGAAALAACIPHLEIAVIEGAGHMVVSDRNDAFDATLLDFLQRRIVMPGPG